MLSNEQLTRRRHLLLQPESSPRRTLQKLIDIVPDDYPGSLMRSIVVADACQPSQKNKKLKDGSLELTFDVAGTKEIKTWIMGFGSLAKALELASLVREIKVDLGKALSFYAK